MFHAPKEPAAHALLRQTAEDKIRSGSAPETYGRSIGASSLTLLHRLASDPETAGDALKLLHEMQVHQVELDLQHEHLIEESQVLSQSAHRLAEMYIFAPVAYFMVTSAGELTEANVVGSRMFGMDRDKIGSQNLVRLAAPDSRPALLALLKQVQSTGLRHSCRVQALDTARNGWLQVTASASPARQHCLVVVMEVSNTLPAGPHEA